MFFAESASQSIDQQADFKIEKVLYRFNFGNKKHYVQSENHSVKQLH